MASQDDDDVPAPGLVDLDFGGDDVPAPLPSGHAGFPRPSARARRCREVPRSGRFGAWLVADDDVRPRLGSHRRALGIAVCEWKVLAPTPELDSTHMDMAKLPRGHHPLKPAWGYLHYIVHEMHSLDQPVVLDAALALKGTVAAVRLGQLCSEERFCCGDLSLDEAKVELDLRLSSVLVLDSEVAGACRGVGPILVRSVRLGKSPQRSDRGLPQ